MVLPPWLLTRMTTGDDPHVSHPSLFSPLFSPPLSRASLLISLTNSPSGGARGRGGLAVARARGRLRWRRLLPRAPPPAVLASSPASACSSPELLHRRRWLLHRHPFLHRHRLLELTGKIRRGCSTSAQLLASLASPRPCVSFEPGCDVSCCRSRP